MTAPRDRTPRRGPSRWRRLRAVLAAGLVLGAGASVSLAAWTDRERAGAMFTAGTMAAPIIEACSMNSPLLATETRIDWRLPPGYAPPEYTSAHLVLESSDGEPGAEYTTIEATTTGPDDGLYRTTVPIGLLDSLLGTDREVQIALSLTAQPGAQDAWTSERVRVISNFGLILGLGASCEVLD